MGRQRGTIRPRRVTRRIRRDKSTAAVPSKKSRTSVETAEKGYHFESSYEVFILKPPKSDAENKEFGRLVQFIGFCCVEYADDIKGFAAKLGTLLEKQLNVLSHSLRSTLVRTLITMRNKEQLSPTDLLALFFRLFRCHDKSLRAMLYNHIVGDITTVNKKRKDNALNRTLVNFMYTMLEDQDPTAAKKSLDERRPVRVSEVLEGEA